MARYEGYALAWEPDLPWITLCWPALTPLGPFEFAVEDRGLLDYLEEEDEPFGVLERSSWGLARLLEPAQRSVLPLPRAFMAYSVQQLRDALYGRVLSGLHERLGALSTRRVDVALGAAVLLERAALSRRPQLRSWSPSRCAESLVAVLRDLPPSEARSVCAERLFVAADERGDAHIVDALYETFPELERPGERFAASSASPTLLDSMPATWDEPVRFLRTEQRGRQRVYAVAADREIGALLDAWSRGLLQEDDR